MNRWQPDGSPRTFTAPAKVNLALRVVGKRADGYHLLQSIMAFFPLYDRLTILLMAEGVELVCDPPVTARPEENLVFRAAQSLLNACGLPRGARLHLQKQIPDGAGLGGGSSDAALVLLALNQMWGLSFTLERLLELGVALGADVPFFLGGQTALVQGIGERLIPAPDCPHGELVLVYPGIALSTRRVFQSLAGRFPPLREPLAKPTPQLDLATLFENDLEPPAMALEPVIGEVAMALQQAGARKTLMSGSGSSVFGLFQDPTTAQDAVKRLTKAHADWRIFSGGIFHQHPFLHEWALPKTSMPKFWWCLKLT